MKKLLMIIPVFLFAFALSASASDCNPCPGPDPVMECCPSIDVSNKNMSKVNGNIGMTTNTGWNTASMNAGIGKIDTGNATAGASLQQQVGYNETRIVAPWINRVRVNSTNMSMVNGNIGMTTNTGGNHAIGNAGMVIEGSICPPKITITKEGRGVVTTGNANATAGMVQLIGSNFTKITNIE